MSTLGHISIDSSLSAPLYLQLYAHLRSSILKGVLKHGDKLPSSRTLADELNISRNTVLNAYRQLLAEGYLEGMEGSGTFVARVTPDLTFETPKRQLTAGPSRNVAAKPLFSTHARLQLATAETEEALPRARQKPRPFRGDLPALDAFPYKLWSRLSIRRARHMDPNTFAYQDSAGYQPLREAIAAHVTVTRQVHCTADQIVIVSGSQGAMDLTSRMLLNPGDSVWIEDPGYPGARGAFLGMNARVVPVPVDQAGLVVEAGVKHAPNARLVYVTPSHQFPLGVTMSLPRRLDLLEWAKQADAYVLEDDYDSEYRFTGRPLAALQGLDNAERVIYIGTFSKVLFPGLRIGYLILPVPLVEAFLTVRRLIDMHVPVFEQAVLADFMLEGHFMRHLRRMRTLYAERRHALLKAVADFEPQIEMDAPQAGIHCVGWLPDRVDDRALVRKAAERDLHLTSLSNYAIEPMRTKGLLFGYGGFSVREIRKGVQQLAEIMRTH